MHKINGTIKTIKDGGIKIKAGSEIRIIKDGLQPYLFYSSKGALVVQGWVPFLPENHRKSKYHGMEKTVVSRDDGITWQQFMGDAGQDKLSLQGGVAELNDGRIIFTECTVVPSDKPGVGIGRMWESTDDWKTLNGPLEVKYHIPEINFEGCNDNGTPVNKACLHRTLVELPNGDLITLLYGWFKGDNRPADYLSVMSKTRVIMLRSRDGGKNWHYVSTVAVDPDIGTEGFNEGVLIRISGGRHQGRFLCIMRTGRELHRAYSDDEGLTWSRPEPVVFGPIDINNTPDWAGMFAGVETENGPAVLEGAFVDPDLIEMKNGMLACSFGVRIPEQANWIDPSYKGNGNYLAFSSDQGETWEHIVRVTSGIRTTHYTAIAEIEENILLYLHDLGSWGEEGRFIIGRKMEVRI